MEMIVNKVLQGDGLELINNISDKSIDMILCDLPYGTTKCKWDIVIPFNDYVVVEVKKKQKMFYKKDFLLWCYQQGETDYNSAATYFEENKSIGLWTQYKRVIKDNGVIILFGKQPFTSDLINSNREMFRYELIWEKTRAGNNMQVKNQPSAIHENIEVFYKEQPVYNDLKFKVDEKYIDKRKSIRDSFYKSEHYTGVMKRKADDGWRHPQSILPFNSVWHAGMHPTEKPVELFEWLIKSYTNENALVLDNCIGSGTTAIACINTNRNFIGFEKNKEYYNMCVKRIEECFRLKMEKKIE